ncbi:MAG: TolC family protein [Bacteroidetes bacterium]|nr:TolC family protein [Bacteroidota bacterium]
MKKNIQHLTFIALMLIAASIKAQNSIDNVLSEIAENNKSIIANQQYWEAKKLQYSTGLTPYNPSVEYDYIIGTPAGAGNQTEFYILQSFDFPTTYIKKKQVADRQISQTVFQLTAYRQDILLKAKQYCIELIYFNKRQVELKKRLQNAEKLYNDYQKKLDKGDASSLDVNKAKLQLLILQNDLRLSTSQINQHNQKLTELNGGIFIAFNDTIYPLSPIISDFQTLESTIEANDPVLKSFQQQKEINIKQVQLSKALALPKMETGYHSLSTFGQKFRGVYFGITIPLWENKNTIKFQKAEVLFSELQVEKHRNQRYHEIQQLFEKYENLNIALEEYQQLLSAINNMELLEKALELGEISSIQFFMEISYFYNSYDKYLQLEKEYHQVTAELYKYQL